MILRNLGIRHGRRVIASSLPRRCIRPFSNDPFPPRPSMPSAFAEPSPYSEDPYADMDEFAEMSAYDDPTAFSDDPLPPTQEPLAEVVPQPMPTNPAILARMAREAAAARIPGDFKVQREIYKRTAHLGGKAKDVRWHLNQVLKDAPEDASLELLLASQTHMGHHTSLWNPNNSKYIYGVRSGIHIISLETTQQHLRRAARVVEEVAFNGGLILFAGTRRGQMPIVVRAAELAGACHLFNKWKPGTITNRDVILGDGGIQVVNELDEPLPGFEAHVQDTRPLVPDLVVCFNPIENYTMLYECGLENVPTIGVIDTNADPSWVTYTIPANDDSLRSISVIACVLGRAGERGTKRRLALARQGKVTWQNPREVQHFMKQTALEKARATEGDKEGGRDDLAALEELSDLELETIPHLEWLDELRDADGKLVADLSDLYTGGVELHSVLPHDAKDPISLRDNLLRQAEDWAQRMAENIDPDADKPPADKSMKPEDEEQPDEDEEQPFKMDEEGNMVENKEFSKPKSRKKEMKPKKPGYSQEALDRLLDGIDKLRNLTNEDLQEMKQTRMERLEAELAMDAVLSHEYPVDARRELRRLKEMKDV